MYDYILFVLCVIGLVYAIWTNTQITKEGNWEND